ncbi:MAG TPA: hypothetical protein PKA82_13845 [Pyrinomonadaceae bacterium]|nr:hypothetical protein [Pyrinomonadaceae bacterium]
MTGTQGSDLNFINEVFDTDSVTAEQLDLLLADGWRHFGTRFFRYNLNIYNDEIVRVLPLRIDLSKFDLSRSQRRVIKNNRDISVEFGPAVVTDEIQDMFDRHKQRFDHGVPDSIFDFLSREPALVPCECQQIVVRDDVGKLLAVSYFDIGRTSTSAIYGCFDPYEQKRSLGILTMIKVIEYSQDLGKEYYYHGYAYDASSFYDYKKRFSAIEVFDWNGNWEKF